MKEILTSFCVPLLFPIATARQIKEVKLKMSVSRIILEAHNRQNARAKISVPFYFSERQSPARYASADCKSSPFPQQEIHHTEDLSTMCKGRKPKFSPFTFLILTVLAGKQWARKAKKRLYFVEKQDKIKNKEKEDAAALPQQAGHYDA